MKGILMPLIVCFFHCSAHQHCVVSVHVAQCLASWEHGPLPPPPPKSALDYGPVMAVTHLSRVGELVHVALLTPNSLTQRLLGSAGVVSLYRIK